MRTTSPILQRWFALCGLLLLGWALADSALAAEEGRSYRLLIVDSQMGKPYDEIRAALSQALESFGYAEGRNLHIRLRVTDNDVKAGEAMLRSEVAANRYDVIYVGGTAATLSARNVLLGNPGERVVFGAPTDPVGIGVIKDFKSRPSANFTGVCFPVPLKARFRFLRQLLPEARNIGLIYADMPQSRSYNQWVQQLVDGDPEFRDLKVIFRSVPLQAGEQGERAMAEAAGKLARAMNDSVDVFLKPNDQMGTRRFFSEAVYQNASKPLIGLVRDDVMGQWGATAVVYPSHQSIGRQAARMIRDLFQGARIADIAPEWPKEYGFAVDLPKARQFALRIPLDVIQMAGDNVIK